MSELARSHHPAVVGLPGDLGVPHASQITERVRAALTPGLHVLIADLTRAVFCDVAGARFLLRAHAEAAANGTELRLIVPPGLVRHILLLTDLDRQVALYLNLTDAIAGQTAVAPIRRR